MPVMSFKSAVVGLAALCLDEFNGSANNDIHAHQDFRPRHQLIEEKQYRSPSVKVFGAAEISTDEKGRLIVIVDPNAERYAQGDAIAGGKDHANGVPGAYARDPLMKNGSMRGRRSKIRSV